MAIMSCEEEGLSDQNKGKAKPTVAIALSGSPADSAFSFTLSASSEAYVYAYAILSGQGNTAPDAQDILYNEVTSAVAASSFMEASSGLEQTVAFEGGYPASGYEIFACAITETGLVGEVSSLAVSTIDTYGPNPLDFNDSGSSCAITFDEAITNGTGDVILKYYAINDDDFYSGSVVGGYIQDKPAGSVTVSKDNIVCSGNIATISLEGVPAGAYYAVAYDDAAFMDLYGNAVARLNSVWYVYNDTPSGRGIYGQASQKSFDFSCEFGESFVDYESPIELTIGSEYGYGYTYSSKPVTVTYAGTGKSTNFTLTSGTDYGYSASADKYIIYLPEEPEFGDKVTVTVPAGAVEDYYGNLNEAFTLNTLYSYGYSLEDVLGTYTGDVRFVSGSSLYRLPSTTMVIEALSQEDETDALYIQAGYNVKMTSWDAFYEVPTGSLYGTFDGVFGTLSFPTANSQGASPVILGYGDYDSEGAAYRDYIGICDADIIGSSIYYGTEIEWAVPAAGTISTDYVMWYYETYALENGEESEDPVDYGAYTYTTPGTMTRTSAATAAAKSSGFKAPKCEKISGAKSVPLI